MFPVDPSHYGISGNKRDHLAGPAKELRPALLKQCYFSRCLETVNKHLGGPDLINEEMELQAVHSLIFSPHPLKHSFIGESHNPLPL